MHKTATALIELNIEGVVTLTADPTSTCRTDALDAGCDACVYKGFTIEEVFASIRTFRK